jgi:hypothetical protein
MNTPRTLIPIWVAAVTWGCLDLELLDEMIRIDAGTGESTEHDSDSAGPPPLDPLDQTAPQLIALACASRERLDQSVCLAEGPNAASLRLATDEPAVFDLTAAGENPAEVLSSAWSTEHHGAVGDLPSDQAQAVIVGVVDVNGNRREVTVTVEAQGGPAVAITEVLANPLGPEPAQEFVEIANTGKDQVDISAWMIDDNGDQDGDLVPSSTVLAPGGVALLVGPGYDPAQGQDPAPAAGALLVFFDSSLCSGGLKNTDPETVELYDQTGQLISTCPAQSPPAGTSLQRLLADLPDADPLAWAPHPASTSTPGQTAAL